MEHGRHPFPVEITSGKREYAWHRISRWRKARRAALSNERGYASAFMSLGLSMNTNDVAAQSLNPLRNFFENRTEGRGIWKWTALL